MIAVVDYGAGNTYSVFRAFDYLGVDAIVTADAQVIAKAERIVLPGVGAFSHAMGELVRSGLVDVLNDEVLAKGKPFMGICLGMQLLADYGDEVEPTEGLGWISGKVRRIPEQVGIKIPHVGWSDIVPRMEHPLISGISGEKSFYFVHSYYLDAEEEGCILAKTHHGVDFPSIVIKNNIFATQFHPEKSQKNGLQLLENFSLWRP